MQEIIDRVKELIAAREKIDLELAQLFTGVAPTKRTLKCSGCGSTEHTLRKCPQKEE